MALTHPVVGMEPKARIGRIARGNGIFDGPEPPEEKKFSIYSNIGGPSASAWLKPNADNAGLVALADTAIPVVFSAGNIPKVAYPVIRPVAVDVVDFIRQMPVNIHPSQPMGCDLDIAEFAVLVSVPVCRGESLSSCISSIKHAALLFRRPLSTAKQVWRNGLPSKRPSVWVVIQKGLHNTLRDVAHWGSIHWLIAKYTTYRLGVNTCALTR